MQDASGAPSPTRAAAKKRAMEKANLKTQKLVSLSTAMESIQAQTEPIDEQEHLPYVSFSKPVLISIVVLPGLMFPFNCSLNIDYISTFQARRDTSKKP